MKCGFWIFLIRYELHAIRLAKLKEIASENGKSAEDTNACEVEMSETKRPANVPPPTP